MWQTLNKASNSIMEWLFGYDVFISYKWFKPMLDEPEGRPYAEALEQALQFHNYRCFLDSRDFIPGSSLDSATKSSLDNSSALVLVATPNCLQSDSVCQEIAIFLESNRPIVPINIDGTREKGESGKLKSEDYLRLGSLLWVEESKPDPKSPSEAVVETLVQSFKATRRKTRRMQTFSVIAAVLLVLLVVAIWFFFGERTARRRADLENRRARATAMAIASERQRAERPERATLLAVEATEATQRYADAAVPAARQALWSSLAVISGQGLERLGGPVTALAFSHDGTWLAASGADTPSSMSVEGSARHVVRLWLLDSKGVTGSSQTLREHTDMIRELAFDPNNQWLLTASDDGTARLWRLGTEGGAKSGPVLRHDNGGIRAVVVSQDSEWILTAGSNGEIRRWPFPQCRNRPGSEAVWKSELVGRHSAEVRGLRLTGRGRVVSWSEDRTARQWHIAPTENLLSYDPYQHPYGLWDAAITRDGHWLLTGGGGGHAQLWNLWQSQNDPTLVFPGGSHDSFVHQVAISPDDRWVATRGWLEKKVVLWSLTPENIGELRSASPSPTDLLGHSDSVNDLAFVPSGGMLATVSSDRTVRLWALPSLTSPLPSEGLLFGNDDRHTPAFKTPLRVSTALVLKGSDDSLGSVAVARRHDGSVWLAAGGDDGSVRLWNLEKPYSPLIHLLIRGPEKHSSISVAEAPKAAFAKAGRYVLIAGTDGTLKAIDVSTRKTIAVRNLSPERISSLLAVEDGSLIVTGFKENGVVRLFRLDDLASDKLDEIAKLEGMGSKITSLCLTHNGRWLYVGGFEGVWRWDFRGLLAAENKAVHSFLSLATHSNLVTELLWPDEQDGVCDMTLSSDGKSLVAWGLNKTLYLYGSSDDREINAIALPMQKEPSIGQFAEGSDWLFVGDDSGRIIRWDLRSWEPSASKQPPSLSWRGHGSEINAMRIEKNRNQLITADSDGKVRIWTDIYSETPRLVKNLTPHDESITSIALSKDGERLATGGWDRTIRAYRLDAHGVPTGNGVVLRGQADVIRSLSFSPNDQYLLVPSDDGNVCVWNMSLDVHDLLMLARKAVGRKLHLEEWNQVLEGMEPPPSMRPRVGDFHQSGPFSKRVR